MSQKEKEQYISWKITTDTANLLLNILNDTPLPHKVSNPLIADLQKQAQEQLTPKIVPPSEEEITDDAAAS